MCRSFESFLAELCAPTLAGVKPASLFRYQPRPGENVGGLVDFWAAALAPRGVSVQLLKECPHTGAALVYVYRPARLESILQDAAVRQFLRGEGYRLEDKGATLEQLSDRLCCDAGFPHEIGVFLGYPLTDVIGFIQNKGRNYTCCGYWKTYGDPTEAKRCFARYRKCEQVYRRLHDQGRTLWQLTVAA